MDAKTGNLTQDAKLMKMILRPRRASEGGRRLKEQTDMRSFLLRTA